MGIGDLYTPEEIAQRLKLTKYTVYEMIKRGDLEAHRLGANLRISEEQFDRYLNRSKGSTNTYDAILSEDLGATIAMVGSVRFVVNSDRLGSARISIRPEDILLSKETVESSANNILAGTVTELYETSGGVKVILYVGVPMAVLITRQSAEKLQVQVGGRFYAIFKAMSIQVHN